MAVCPDAPRTTKLGVAEAEEYTLVTPKVIGSGSVIVKVPEDSVTVTFSAVPLIPVISFAPTIAFDAFL